MLQDDDDHDDDHDDIDDDDMFCWLFCNLLECYISNY